MATTSRSVHAEHRFARRYPIVAPVMWEDGQGVTEDVSTAGAYFLTERPLAKGQFIRLTVTLPRQAVAVTGQATVVRIDARRRAFGIGVRLENLEIAPAAAPPGAPRQARTQTLVGTGRGARRSSTPVAL